MPRILFGIILLLAACLSGPAFADPWQTVSSSQGRFSAQMPGQPSVNVEKHGTAVGTITENTYTVKGASGTYQVEYQDLPGVAMLFKGKKGIIARAKKGFLEDAHATEVSTTAIKIDGHDATRLVYSEGGTQGDVVFLMVGNRLYVFNAQGADADRFFGSVKIGPAVATGQ